MELLPGYEDAYLRLACVARNSGNLEEATNWASKAAQQGAGHLDAQALLVGLHLERK